MSGRPVGALGEMLDERLAAALPGAGGLRPQLESARAGLAGKVTVVVTGRRGSGKTTVVNELLCEPVGQVGYSAEDRPIQIVGSRVDESPPWAVTTRVPEGLARGRCFVELPDHLAGRSAGGVATVRDFNPEVLIHVTRHRLRSDELLLLDEAQREWRLGPLEVIVVGAEWTPLGVEGISTHEVARRLDAVERFVDGRRCDGVMRLLESFAARSDDRVWATRLIDDIEQLSLTPQGHVVRERWAHEAALSRRADVPEALRADLARLSFGEPDGSAPDSATLLGRAADWQSRVPALAPLAAEVARVVARGWQLRSATAPALPAP